MMNRWAMRFLKAHIVRDGCLGATMGIERKPSALSYNELLVRFLS